MNSWQTKTYAGFNWWRKLLFYFGFLWILNLWFWLFLRVTYWCYRKLPVDVRREAYVRYVFYWGILGFVLLILLTLLFFFA
jgi:hypothetical protein